LPCRFDQRIIEALRPSNIRRIDDHTATLRVIAQKAVLASSWSFASRSMNPAAPHCRQLPAARADAASSDLLNRSSAAVARSTDFAVLSVLPPSLRITFRHSGAQQLFIARIVRPDTFRCRPLVSGCQAALITIGYRLNRR